MKKKGVAEKEQLFRRRLWAGLLVMALASPLGLFLPRLFRAGEPWGEWGPEELKRLLGYLPEGLARLSRIWRSPLGDYSLNPDHPSFFVQSLWYILSALIGCALIVGLIYLLKRCVVKRGN